MNDALTSHRHLTPSQGPGPYYGFSMLYDGSENAVEPGSVGAIEVRGRLLDGRGRAITPPDGLIEVLQGDQFARLVTDAEGQFSFTVRKPDPVPLSDGRPQAPFFHVIFHIFPLAELHRTRLYFPDETEANAADPLLSGVEEADRASLIARPEGDILRWDVVLAGPSQTAFLVATGEPSLLDGGQTPAKALLERTGA